MGGSHGLALVGHGMSDAMREAFEAWATRHVGEGLDFARHDGKYLDVTIEGWHHCWQAATTHATAVERERCARVCEQLPAYTWRQLYQENGGTGSVPTYTSPKDCAAAIRAQGES